MRLQTKAAAYGVAGLVIAGALIFSGSALGFLNSSPTGVLSVLLTDPPSVPDGVTAVYITYSDIAVHATGFGDSGWVSVPGMGTIDTLGLVNLSRTISSGSIPMLTYNLVRLNISSASVEFNGKNYSVTVNSGRLTVPFVGGLKVNSSNEAAALVDISPTVLNLGNQSDPNFTMAAGARALQVPSDEVGKSMREVGNETSLQGRGWFQSFRANRTDSITISGLALTSNSFSFTAFNQGSDSATIRMVIVTQDAPKTKASAALGSVASSFVFAVETNGSLELVSGNVGHVQALFGSSGYSLPAGATHHFNFAGAISSVQGSRGILTGANYDVVVIGSETLGVQTVTAA